MKLTKAKIIFNSEESIEILFDANVCSEADLQKVADEFMETTDYNTNQWDSETIKDWFVDSELDGIYVLDNEAVEIEIPEINND
jgi:hypothetical protein